MLLRADRACSELSNGGFGLKIRALLAELGPFSVLVLPGEPVTGIPISLISNFTIYRWTVYKKSTVNSLMEAPGA